MADPWAVGPGQHRRIRPVTRVGSPSAGST